jgi:thiamine biosynthesis lipoprotein
MRYLESVMGIPMSIDIRDPGAHGEAARDAFAVLAAADVRFSTYRTTSEVSAVNRGEITVDRYSDDLREVIEIGTQAADQSGGAFRIRTTDGRLDLDGVVKGWAAARAVETLERAGVHNFCLNAGGDVAVAGSPEPPAPWNVGVRSPGDPAQMLAVLAVTDGAVATSGAYERGQHIVDGRTGETAHGLASASVIADDLTTADVLATGVFALGLDGPDWAHAHGARGVIALTEDGALVIVGDVAFPCPPRLPL